jgi:aminopeptidase I
MSLRSSMQEDAASKRIAELEAQVELLTRQSAMPGPQMKVRSTSEQMYQLDEPVPTHLAYKRANGELEGQRAAHVTMYQEYADMMSRQSSRHNHTLKAPEAYTEPFCNFLTENPTVWHAVDYFEEKLQKSGFKKARLRYT